MNIFITNLEKTQPYYAVQKTIDTTFISTLIVGASLIATAAILFTTNHLDLALKKFNHLPSIDKSLLIATPFSAIAISTTVSAIYHGKASSTNSSESSIMSTIENDPQLKNINNNFTFETIEGTNSSKIDKFRKELTLMSQDCDEKISNESNHDKEESIVTQYRTQPYKNARNMIDLTEEKLASEKFRINEREHHRNQCRVFIVRDKKTQKIVSFCLAEQSKNEVEVLFLATNAACVHNSYISTQRQGPKGRGTLAMFLCLEHYKNQNIVLEPIDSAVSYYEKFGFEKQNGSQMMKLDSKKTQAFREYLIENSSNFN